MHESPQLPLATRLFFRDFSINWTTVLAAVCSSFSSFSSVLGVSILRRQLCKPKQCL